MRKKAFTLTEVIIIVVVLGILVTIAVTAYGNMVENSKAQVCLTNQEALKTALDIYAMERDAMPGTLGQIPSQYIDRAFAQILQRKGAWKIKLAYFVVGLEERGLAYAGLLDMLARGDGKLLTCPKNNSGGNSYGMNSVLAGMSSTEYKGLPAGTLLIADCNATTFTVDDSDNVSGLAEDRHRLREGVRALGVNHDSEPWQYQGGSAREIHRLGRGLSDDIKACNNNERDKKRGQCNQSPRRTNCYDEAEVEKDNCKKDAYNQHGVTAARSQGVHGDND